MKIKQHGFTLTELLIAFSLTTGLSIVIMTLIIQTQQMSVTMIAKSQLNAEARLIFEMLGTGQARDVINGAAKNSIIDNTERIISLREANNVVINNNQILRSFNNGSATANSSGVSSIITVSNDENTDNNDNRLIMQSGGRIKGSSTTNPNVVNCRTNRQDPNNANDPLAGGALAGDPYFDCTANQNQFTPRGYMSYLIVDPTNRSINNRTVDVEYMLVDPRLAGWRSHTDATLLSLEEQTYLAADYRETYRTSFMMNTNQ